MKIFIDDYALMSDINKEKHYKIIRRRPWGWYMRNKVFYFDSGCT
jgi:hypothetical protein